MQIPEINLNAPDADTQLKMIVTKCAADSSELMAFLQGELCKLSIAEAGLSKVRETVQTGSAENVAKQLDNTMRSVIQQNQILQRVIYLLIVYAASGKFKDDTYSAALACGADPSAVLGKIFKDKLNGK